MISSVERQREAFSARVDLRNTLADGPQLVDQTPPSLWFRQVARGLLETRKRLEDIQPVARNYLQPFVDKSLQLMRDECAVGLSTEDEMAVLADKIIMRLSHEVSKTFRYEVAPVPGKFIGMSELLEQHPDRLRRTNELRNGVQFELLGIKNPSTGEWHDVPLPFDKKMWHKGGIARAVLDVFAGAPDSMLASELPVNDLDVVTTHNEEEARRQANLMGVDPQGVEIVEGEIDMGMFFAGRDTTQNMVCLGVNGLYYADKAFEAAKTGHIEIVGNYFPEHAIYNNASLRFVDTQTNQVLTIPKPSGQMRLIKVVAEGKALSFDHMPITTNLDFGIYALSLAKRWVNKPNFPELMQRMFALLQKTGQTRPAEENIIDTLTRVHREYPFFDFDDCISTMTDVVTWKMKRLVRQIDTEFARLHELPPSIEFKRQPGDTDPQEIDLEDFNYSDQQTTEFVQRWPGFLEDCKTRKDAYHSSPIPVSHRYFYALDQNELFEDCAN
jgi:hypothetical protein